MLRGGQPQQTSDLGQLTKQFEDLAENIPETGLDKPVLFHHSMLELLISLKEITM
jgi:hypothetical protein